MTWKERKECENRKVVDLGGKVRTLYPSFMFTFTYILFATCKLPLHSVSSIFIYCGCLYLFKTSLNLCLPLKQPPKKQRLTLSVARPMMKKQKEREEKMLQEVIDFFHHPLYH